MNLNKGTKIKITSSKYDGTKEFYETGHVGVIDHFDGKEYWVNFNNQENSFIYEEGIWCIGDGTINNEYCAFQIMEGN